MLGFYRAEQPGTYRDVAVRVGVGQPSKNRLGFGCVFADLDLDGDLDLVVANGHIDDTVRNIPGNVGYAQPPHLFLNDRGTFRDVATQVGGGFEQPRVGRGLAVGDFDRDGDLDLLMTTNNGPAVLFRNDLQGANRSVRFRLVGTTSNRDAIGATIRVTSRRGHADTHGAKRVQLSVAVRAARHLRRWRARRGRSRRHHLAERAHRGLQERRDRQGVHGNRRQGARSTAVSTIRSIVRPAPVRIQLLRVHSDSVTRRMPYIDVQMTFLASARCSHSGPRRPHRSPRLTNALLHAPNSLTQGERELIAAYVSALNGCTFCFRSHAAIAAWHLVGRATGRSGGGRSRRAQTCRRS